MAKIVFKGKRRKMVWTDGSLAYEYVKIPKLTRKHCRMETFKNDKRYDSLVNSDLFNNLLAKINKDLGEKIRMDRIPDNVIVDHCGLLSEITVIL